MTSGTVSKKIRQYSRRQMRGLYPHVWAAVNKEFFAMLPKLAFWERVKLALKIIRAKPIKTEVKQQEGGG